MDLKHEKCLAPNGLFKLFGAFFSCFIKCRVCTGGKTTVLGIRKSGIRSLKKSLYMGSMVYLSNAMKNGSESSWIKDRLKTKRKKVIICAIMNRLARIAYAVAKNGEPFDETRCNLIKKLR